MILIYQISISYFQLPAGYTITSGRTQHSSLFDILFILHEPSSTGPPFDLALEVILQTPSKAAEDMSPTF